MRDSRSRRRVGRRGLAPLEMVMSLPFLAGAAAMIFSVLTAAITRSSMAVDARHEIWKLRDSPAQSAPAVTGKRYTQTAELSAREIVTGNTSSGWLSGSTKTKVRIAYGLGPQIEVGGSSITLVRTWDHRDVHQFKTKAPHFDVVGAMGGINLGTVPGIARILF